MKKPDFLNDIAKKLCDSLPTSLKTVKKDVEKNFHAVLKNAFNKLDLVTREEFDAQVKVLARSRKRIEELADELKKLEKSAKKK